MNWASDQPLDQPCSINTELSDTYKETSTPLLTMPKANVEQDSGFDDKTFHSYGAISTDTTDFQCNTCDVITNPVCHQASQTSIKYKSKSAQAQLPTTSECGTQMHSKSKCTGTNTDYDCLCDKSTYVSVTSSNASTFTDICFANKGLTALPSVTRGTSSSDLYFTNSVGCQIDGRKSSPGYDLSDFGECDFYMDATQLQHRFRKTATTRHKNT